MNIEMVCSMSFTESTNQKKKKKNLLHFPNTVVNDASHFPWDHGNHAFQFHTISRPSKHPKVQQV